MPNTQKNNKDNTFVLGFVFEQMTKWNEVCHLKSSLATTILT